MITILEKSEHNVDFHQMVDFVEASFIRYALTIYPTVYVSHIRQFWSTARIETTDEGTNIIATVDGKLMTIFESSIRRNLKLNDEEGISTTITTYCSFITITSTCYIQNNLTSTPTEIPILRQYSRRARIAQSSALPTAADEPASLFRDDSQGEAFPTVSGLEVEQDRKTIIKTSALPHDSTPTQSEMATKFAAQELEIASLKARIKLFKDKDRGGTEPSAEDATIKGRSLETGEEAGVERSTKRCSNDTEELVNVLTSLDAANILMSRAQVVSVPPAVEVSTVGIPTGSGMVPTASPIFTTASVVTPYSRRKGKEKMVELDIDVQVAREIEEQLAREDQRRDEQIARDVEIARIHAEEELQMLIDGLDRNNEIIAKYLQEYEQFASDFSIGEKIDMINELAKYQDHYAKVLKYKSQQSKPLSKKQQKEFYMSVLKSHSAWKTKHFKAKDVSEEDLKEMMQLVPVKELYVEALQVKLPIIDWEIYSEGQRNY
uniref:Xylulose kinase-1 n=1 Tax=Tanacetum cinerariifolium TaxID=118510 RepID=A0A699H3X1_TANCI|nr:hypothetical protein [Tanacetum cinerariifolium]